MGQLIYDSQQLSLKLEDRALAHLQIVIVNLLRRDEKFLFSWKDDVTVGDGRSSIWLHPYCGLHFKFAGSRVPAINRTWLEQLYDSAASGSGLVLSREPADTSGDDIDADVPGMPVTGETITAQ